MSANAQRRRKPWTIAVLASAGMHLAAILALGTIMGRHSAAGWEGSARHNHAMTVVLLRLPQGWSTPQPQARPSPLAAVKSAPAAPAPDAVAESLPAAAAAASGPPGDIDALFRAPFRDAVSQAYASLRGGLGCAHVVLSNLPDDVRALCDAAIRLKGSQADIRPG